MLGFVKLKDDQDSEAKIDNIDRDLNKERGYFDEETCDSWRKKRAKKKSHGKYQRNCS